MTYQHSFSEPNINEAKRKLSKSNVKTFVSNSAVSSQKSKLQTSSSASRLIPKKIWKSRSKSSGRNNSIIPQWVSQGHCRWLSSTGRWYNLCDTSLLDLSEMERSALKQIATARLQAFKLGCKIESPKEHSVSEKKRRPYMLKKKALTTGMFDRKEKRTQDIPSGLVFGTSLEKCLENDRLMKGKSSRDKDSPKVQVRSRSTTHASLLGKTLKTAASCHSLSDIFCQDDENKRSMLNYGYSESNESLDLEKKNRLFGKSDSIPDLDSLSLVWNRGPSVPSIVETCFRHLETYGLNTVGVFRVSSSKKRVRQLRDEFDSGNEVTLTEENHPHDVAQLLKEYFRDLKEPLLSKELYSAFIGTKRLKNKQDQREALQYLLCLLPTANRDTLWSLLNFLNNVASHSEDTKDESGEILAGNKMDSLNLATVFGPNILRSYKSGSEKEYKVESVMRAEERSDVIRVMQMLIDHQISLFMLNADLLDHVYLHIQHKDPNSLNSLLCVKSNMSDYEAENEPFGGLKMSSRRFSDSVETIAKDDSSEINSPLGSASSFNEIMFMDADDVKNGYPTRRGHSASNLPTFSQQDRNRLQTNGHLNQLDQRRRSSEDVNQNTLKPNVLTPGDQALSVPDVSLRRLSASDIDNSFASNSATSSRAASTTPSPTSVQKSSSSNIGGNQEMVVSDKPPPKASPDEPTKPILKSPTEHFKVFVTDDTSGTERLAGEFQTVKFTTNLVESTRISRPQRPQICHLLTMPQSAIMRLPKFTLSESTIEEHTGASGEVASGDEEENKAQTKTTNTTETTVQSSQPAEPQNPIAPSKSTSKLHGILKNLKGDKNKQDDNSITRKGSGSEKSKPEDQNPTSTKAPDPSKKSPSEQKAPDAPPPRRRFRPKASESISGSPTRTRKDFLRRRRIRDKAETKVPESKEVPRTSCREVSNAARNEDDKKPEQWKRWEIISSEHMETLV